jgi:hypothetical protein
MFSGANASLAALLAGLLSTSPACAGDGMDGMPDHGHNSSEFVLFLSAEAHHSLVMRYWPSTAIAFDCWLNFS